MPALLFVEFGACFFFTGGVHPGNDYQCPLLPIGYGRGLPGQQKKEVLSRSVTGPKVKNDGSRNAERGTESGTRRRPASLNKSPVMLISGSLYYFAQKKKEHIVHMRSLLHAKNVERKVYTIHQLAKSSRAK